ncbi:MAG: hypothetical protein GXP08_15535 [Gammaproteobacteria bacterium]|nr:hypothetical protein [Gammaproteobacteria bacterium]
MAVRLKTKWHKSKRSKRNRHGSNAPKKLQDLASVIGINIWKLAKEAFLRMEKEGYRFKEDSQTINVISEFVIYQLHITDRLIYSLFSEEERSGFMSATAMYLVDLMVENKTDLLGQGEYVDAFIGLMNERMANYAECGFVDDKPSYEFTRYLALNISERMKQTDSKWVVEQVIDIEAPDIAEKINRVVNDVLGLQQRKENKKQESPSS